MSALELGIFTAIDGGAITIEAVAAAVYIHPLNAERLLVMLTAMELVHRADDGTYANADGVDRFLSRAKRAMRGPGYSSTSRNGMIGGD